MKNILTTILQLGCVAFLLAFVFAILNYSFGLRLGIKGAAVPADPAAAVVFLVLAVVFGGIAFLMTRKAKA